MCYIDRKITTFKVFWWWYLLSFDSEVCFISLLHLQPWKSTSALWIQVSMFFFCTYISTFLLTGFWKHISRLFKNKNVSPNFYTVICSVTKLELSVHFVNNQSLCVCCVEIQFLRLSTFSLWMSCCDFT